MFASNRENLSGVLLAVAVKEANLVAGAKPANCSQMVSLGALELNRPGRQWTVGVKSFRHPCYNSGSPPLGMFVDQDF